MVYSTGSHSIVKTTDNENSFGQVLSKVILLVDSSELFAPVFSGVAKESSSYVPVYQSTGGSIFVMMMCGLGFGFCLVKGGNYSLFLLPR